MLLSNCTVYAKKNQLLLKLKNFPNTISLSCHEQVSLET